MEVDAVVGRGCNGEHKSAALRSRAREQYIVVVVVVDNDSVIMAHPPSAISQSTPLSSLSASSFLTE